MQIDILTIFPEVMSPHFDSGLLKKAADKGILGITLHNLRDYTHDRHHSVDDAPFGGGAGMVMKAPPFFEAVAAISAAHGCKLHTVMVTPQGDVFRQKRAQELARLDNILILCGHYEGVDERVRTALADEEISIGDYVLMGGETAALVIVEAVARLLPGVLGADDAHAEESHYAGLLEYPQYTRPASFMGMDAPEILLSGDHKAVDRWRRREMIGRTLSRRPEMLLEADLDDKDRDILCDLLEERSQRDR